MGTSYKICKVVNKWSKHMALDTRGPKRPASEICAELRQTPVDRLLQRSQARYKSADVPNKPPQKTRFQTETKRIFSVNLQETISVFQKRHSWAFSAARGGRTTRHLWVSKYSLTVLFLDTILSSFFAIRMRSSSRVIAAFTRVRTNL